MSRSGLRTRETSLTDPAVRTEWQRLQTGGGVRTPFLTWQWSWTLGAAAGNADSLRVLVVEAPGRAVVGLLPLEWTTGPGRLRTVGAAGWRWLAPDHLDVVALPADRTAVARAVVRHLTGARSWDLLDLDGLVPDGALVDAVAQLPFRYYRPTPQPVSGPWVDLRAGDPAAVLPGRNLRSQVGRGLRAAARAGGGLRVLTGPADIEAALSRLMTLHNARFRERSAVFATPGRRRFHLALARRLAADGLARVYRLETHTPDAALLYALVWERRVFYYAMGIDPAGGGSPGRTVLGGAILAAAEEGFDEFDLLRGDHGFKLRFATAVRDDIRMRVLRPGLRAAFAVAAIAMRRSGEERGSQRPGQLSGVPAGEQEQPSGGAGAPGSHDH